MLLSVAAPASTEIDTLSLHDALPILRRDRGRRRSRTLCRSAFRQADGAAAIAFAGEHPHPERARPRSEEHTSELQSPCNLVCRLLLEKEKRAGTSVSRDESSGPCADA